MFALSCVLIWWAVSLSRRSADVRFQLDMPEAAGEGATEITEAERRRLRQVLDAIDKQSAP